MLGRLLYINPLVVFLATWASVFYLYSLQLSLVLLPLTTEFAVHVVLLGAAASAAFFVGFHASGTRPRPLKSENPQQVRRLIRSVRRLSWCALLVFAVTVIAFGGVPLSWALTGSTLTYTDFGFPTLHGFFNSLILIIGTMLSWMSLRKVRFRGDRLLLAFCFVVPIITLHRQSLVSLLLQCLFIYAALRRGSFGQAAKGVVLILLASGTLFSLLGNIRTGDETLADLANLSSEGGSLPLPVLWIYMYLTTPLSNFFELTTMPFAQSFGGTSLAGLTPTVLRELLWGEPAAVMTEFADRAFNAYTYAFVLFVDFRWWGVFVFSIAVLGVGGVLFRRFVVAPTLYNLLNLCLLNHVIFLFVFANFLLTWGVVFQFVIVRVLKKKLAAIPATALATMPRKSRPKVAPAPDGQPTPGAARGAVT